MLDICKRLNKIEVRPWGVTFDTVMKRLVPNKRLQNYFSHLPSSNFPFEWFTLTYSKLIPGMSSRGVHRWRGLPAVHGTTLTFFHAWGTCKTNKLWMGCWTGWTESDHIAARCTMGLWMEITVRGWWCSLNQRHLSRPCSLCTCLSARNDDRMGK